MQLSMGLAPASSILGLHERTIHRRICGRRRAAHRPKQGLLVHGRTHTRCAVPEPESDPSTLSHKILRPVCSTLASVTLVRETRGS